MALSLTEVRSRYIVRKDATHGRDYVYDVDGDWTDDVFAVAFYEAVVWNYMALALAGPEATLQELKRDRYVPKLCCSVVLIQVDLKMIFSSFADVLD